MQATEPLTHDRVLAERARYVSAGVSTPRLVVASADGARVTDVDGRVFVDFAGGIGCQNTGHRFAPVVDAVHRQVDEYLHQCFMVGIYEPYVDTCRLLAELSPCAGAQQKSILVNSGAEANENAVKIARLVTGRKKIVARNRSYHGATLAMLSLSGDPRRDPFEPGLPGVVRMGDPYCFRCPFGKEPTSCAHECAQDLETVLLREGPDTVAAVILEGIVGANGVFTPPAGYWKKIRAICDRHGVLLIADEVLSGFGRTGRWFAVDHDGVTPDLLTMAKGITGGYVPGGAVIVTDRIARHFDQNVLVCGLTSYAHPLVCEAIVAAIESYRDEGLVDRAAASGRQLTAKFADFARKRPYIGEIRGLGLLWAFELCAPGTRDPLPSGTMAKVAAALRRNHLHMHKRDNLVYFAPPLVITDAELDEAIAAVGAAFDEALGS